MWQILSKIYSLLRGKFSWPKMWLWKKLLISGMCIVWHCIITGYIDIGGESAWAAPYTPAQLKPSAAVTLITYCRHCLITIGTIHISFTKLLISLACCVIIIALEYAVCEHLMKIVHCEGIIAWTLVCNRQTTHQQIDWGHCNLHHEQLAHWLTSIFKHLRGR